MTKANKRLAFIGLKVAFDTIHRSILETCLILLLVPNKIIQVIHLMYKDVRARVQVEREESDTLQIKWGTNYFLTHSTKCRH